MHTVTGSFHSVFKSRFVITDQQAKVQLIKDIYGITIPPDEKYGWNAVICEWQTMITEQYIKKASAFLNAPKSQRKMPVNTKELLKKDINMAEDAIKSLKTDDIIKAGKKLKSDAGRIIRAYRLSKINWKGSKIISSLLLGTMMITYAVTMIPLYRIFSQLGLTNTYVPLILPQFFGSAFFIIIVRQFFRGIPNSVMEAAKIDGANELQRYIHIALPMCKPALTTVAIYSFISSWSDYLAPMIYINKTSKLTLSLGLQQFMSQYNTAWSHLMAAASIFVMPVVIFYVFLQKNFVEGIATSGLKV
jgi:multiple sugar transport system permease protein